MTSGGVFCSSSVDIISKPEEVRNFGREKENMDGVEEDIKV
jgi:hypothetical protein